MTGKVEDIVQDVKIVGSFAKSAGSTVILSIVVAILAISLVASVVVARVGADRYTGDDHKEFTRELKAGTEDRWEDQEAINTSVGETVDQIHEDVIVTKTKVTGMERDLAEIKSLLLRSSR